MAGAVIAVRCVVVIRGTRMPLSVAVMSKAADASGLVVLIPTFWAVIDRAKNVVTTRHRSLLICLFIIQSF